MTETTSMSSPPSHGDCPPGEDMQLPFPTQFNTVQATTELSVEYLSISKLSVKTLQAHCRRFGLKTSGNKAILQARLEAFSKNREAWESLRPGAHKLHKDPRKVTAGIIKTKKLPGLRFAELRGDDLPVASKGVRQTEVEHSKDMWTKEEIEGVLPWARQIMAKYPYIPDPEPEMTAEPEASGPLPQTLTESNLSAIASQIAEQVSAKILSHLQAVTNPATGQ